MKSHIGPKGATRSPAPVEPFPPSGKQANQALLPVRVTGVSIIWCLCPVLALSHSLPLHGCSSTKMDEGWDDF